MGNLRFLTVFIFSILFSLVGFTQEQKELLLNGGFESGVAKWKSYCDAAGITPVDGVGGGVAGFAISASTTSPLAGKSSGIITKDAANRQGCGVATDFTVQEENKAQVLQVKIPYKVTSGTYADDQYKVYVYDIDNASMIEVAPTFIKNSSIKETYRGVFQTSLTGVNYRLIIHNASTSTVASTVKIEASISSQLTATGSFATDSRDYTPSITNNTGGITNYTATGKWTQVGENMLVTGGISFSGTSAAFSNIYVSLPSGNTIDTSKLIYTNGSQILGKVRALRSGVTFYAVGQVAYDTTNRVILTLTQLQTHSGSQPILQADITNTFPHTWTTGDSLNWEFTVPIVGKTSNTVLSNEYLKRKVFAQYKTLGGVTSYSSGQIIKYTTIVEDSHGAYNPTTGLFTCPTNEKYRITNQFYGSGSFTYSYIGKNGSSEFTRMVQAANSGFPATFTVSCNTGETIGIYNAANGVTAVDGASFNSITIETDSSGTQVAASESIAARYKTAAGQSIANASTPIIDFGTKEFDDVGSVTTGGAWKFTPNAAGKFEVCVRVRYANGQVWTATTSYAAAYLYKNGGSYSALGEVFFPATSTPSNSGPHLPGCDVIKLLSTDYIDVRTAHNESSARTLLGSDAHNWITIKRVGNY